MIVGHMAGVPVEETLLGFAPLGIAGLAALTAYASQRLRALLHRPRRRAAVPVGQRDPL